MTKRRLFNIDWMYGALIVLACLLRFMPLPYYQFSHDELSGLSRTQFSDLAQTLRFGVQYTDTHPALIQIFLYYWVKLVGYSEVWVKLPFLLCGLLSVHVSWRFVLNWFGRQPALYVAVILSSSFIFLIYSSYARMYAPGVLFSVLVLQALFSILFSENVKPRSYIAFGVFCLLCAFNNHLNALFAFTAALGGLCLIPRKRLWHYGITCAAIVLCYLPHLPITLTQLQTGGLGVSDNGWLPPPKPAAFIDFVQVLLGTGWAGRLNIVLFVWVMLFSFRNSLRLSRQQWLLLALFLVNFGIIYFYSIFRSPLLQNSVLLFSGICLLFFVASFAGALPKIWFYACAGLSLALCLGQSLFVKDSLRDAHRQDFEMMTAEADSAMHKYGKEKVAAVFNAEPFFISLYEARQGPIPHKLLSDSVFASIPAMQRYFESLPQNKLVLGDVQPLVIAVARRKFPYLLKRQQGFFYNVVTLSKTKSRQAENNTPVLDENRNLLNRPEPFTMETELDQHYGAFRLDSLSGEYPLSFHVPVKNLKATEGQWLLFEADFRTDSLPPAGTDLLYVKIDTGDPAEYYETAARFADFYRTPGSNRLMLQVFMGSGTDAWQRRGTLTCFVWKRDKSSFELQRLRYRRLDYNPSKWSLWH